MTIISEKPLCIAHPYANFVVWIKPDFVKYIETLVKYGDDDDALRLLRNK